jgi:hypothetical protein
MLELVFGMLRAQERVRELAVNSETVVAGSGLSESDVFIPTPLFGG